MVCISTKKIIEPQPDNGLIRVNRNRWFGSLRSGPTRLRSFCGSANRTFKHYSSHTFTLPDIPFNPALHHHAYNQPPDTFHRSFPHTPFTSYNNPAFVVPPSPPHPLYNHVPSSDVNLQLALAPLIPPRVQSHFPQPVY